MSDEQAVKLLEEIRDLQRELLENQKVSLQNQQVSLQNQQQSIARQKSALDRSKISFIVLIVMVLFLGVSFFVPALSWALSWIVRR
jgi:ABC-type antimicrobial peptide transport system permease subunit